MKQRAAQWDQPVSEYVKLSERYLGFQQPGSVYAFADAGDGHKRVNIAYQVFVICSQLILKCLLVTKVLLSVLANNVCVNVAVVMDV